MSEEEEKIFGSLDEMQNRARMEIFKRIDRYNYHLEKFKSNPIITHYVPILFIGVICIVIRLILKGYDLDVIDTITMGLFCFLFAVYSIMTYLANDFFPYLNSPEIIHEKPTIAAFFASFHEGEKKNLKLLEDGDPRKMWKKLLERDEARRKKWNQGRPNSSLVRAMVLDGIYMLELHGTTPHSLSEEKKEEKEEKKI